MQVGKFITAEEFLEDHQVGLIEARRSDTQSLSSKALCFRHLFERRVHQSLHVVVGERRKFSAQGRRCRRQGGRVIVGVVRKLGLYLFTCVYTGTYMSYCGVRCNTRHLAVAKRYTDQRARALATWRERSREKEKEKEKERQEHREREREREKEREKERERERERERDICDLRG